jgi:transposase-like protein
MSGRPSREVTDALWDVLNHGSTIAGAARTHGVHIRSLRRAKRRWEALPPDQRAKMLSPLAHSAILAGAILGPARVAAP